MKKFIFGAMYILVLVAYGKYAAQLPFAQASAWAIGMTLVMLCLWAVLGDPAEHRPALMRERIRNVRRLK